MSVDTSQIAKLDVEPGELPATMAAWVIRAEREGEPIDAFQLEQIEVPQPGAFEVIVRVMAAGVNYNNVWAGRGIPLNVVKEHEKRGDKTGFHIGGSDGLLAATTIWQYIRSAVPRSARRESSPAERRSIQESFSVWISPAIGQPAR